MDSTTLLLVIVPLLFGLVGGAVKFMRLVGFVAGRGKMPLRQGRGSGDQLTFHERVAERLRELDRDRRNVD